MKKLVFFFLLAFGLRLGFGGLAYALLPQYGHGSEAEKAGYVFYDAFRRDTAAWELAQSPQPLSVAFSGKNESDQYGGLLAFSALIYRYLAPAVHQPLWLVFFAAAAGGLGVVFAVLAAKQTLGENAAQRVGWIMALFPESILLGASQMREPFIILFLMMGFYGLLHWRTRLKMAAFWITLALAGLLFISPGFAALLIVIGLGWLFFDGRQVSWQFSLAALVIFSLALLILSASWQSLVTVRSGPLGVLGDWARETAKWNAYILGRSSGIVQLLFKTLPDSLQMPFVALYGVLQPVLPAVIVEPTLPFWRILGIARAAGWWTLLPILGYAPFAAWKLTDPRQRRLWLWLAAVSWAWILVAAVRGGGDQWDNPRYRIILLGWMAMLAAFSCEQLKFSRDRWFLRILAVEAIILVVFGHWYLYRHLGLGWNFGIRNTLIAAIGTATLLVLGDWSWQTHKKRRSQHPL